MSSLLVYIQLFIAILRELFFLMQDSPYQTMYATVGKYITTQSWYTSNCYICAGNVEENVKSEAIRAGTQCLEAMETLKKKRGMSL